MANCNCNDFPISCAPHAPGGDCCHHHHGCPPHPCPPPDYKGGTSMYIGARYVPIFADPVEWDDEREYEPLTIVIKDGDCYTSKCYVPKGAQLPPYPDNQTKYWVKTSDYNYQFADLKKTVTDLSRLVEQFQKDNEKFTELINGWNETVKEWTAKMEEWQGQMDDFKQSVADLTAKLDEEIQRAKDAEQANAAAIAKETADREQAVSELDAAYKAADTSIREDFTAADAAEKAAREAADAQLTTDIAAEKTRAEGQETAIRQELDEGLAQERDAREAADTALSNRITSNKTDIDAIKAEQVIQNTNISNNSKNIADNAAEIAKHADRLSALESNASDWDTVFPDTTIAQEVQKEELARANADTALNGRCDAIAADVEEVRDLANHKVDTTTYTEGQAAQDARIDALETGKADKTDLKDWVLTTTYEAGQAAQDAKIKTNTDNIGAWSTDHPNQTVSECVTSIETEVEAVDAKADANSANIGDWTTDHPGTTISQAVTALENAPGPDLSGYVTKTAADEAYQPKGEYVPFVNTTHTKIQAPLLGQTSTPICVMTGDASGQYGKSPIDAIQPDMSNVVYYGDDDHASIYAPSLEVFNDVTHVIAGPEDGHYGKYAISDIIPDVSGFITKTQADAAYQPKGNYATLATESILRFMPPTLTTTGKSASSSGVHVEGSVTLPNWTRTSKATVVVQLGELRYAYQGVYRSTTDASTKLAAGLVTIPTSAISYKITDDVVQVSIAADIDDVTDISEKPFFVLTSLSSAVTIRIHA